MAKNVYKYGFNDGYEKALNLLKDEIEKRTNPAHQILLESVLETLSHQKPSFTSNSDI